MSRGSSILHFLDRHLGPPLLRLLSLLKRFRKKPEKVQKIAILKLSGIGDLVLITAILQDLKKAFPVASITLFCAKENKALGKLLPYVDHVEVLELFAPIKLLRTLRKKSFDLFFDFGQWSKTEALLTFFSRSKYFVGFQTPGQARHYLYDQFVEHRRDLHEIENFRALLKVCDLKVSAFPLLLFSKRLVFEQSNKAPYFVFHLWPSGLKAELKQWPIPSWLKLAKSFCAKGYQIVLTGSTNDFLKTEAVIKEANFSGLKNLAGKLSLDELGELFVQAKAVVSVNTGIMHMAATLDVPLVALHGPTSIKRWGPLSKKAISLAPKNGSGQYLNLGFEYPNHVDKCMQEISVDMVDEALKSLLVS